MGVQKYQINVANRTTAPTLYRLPDPFFVDVIIAQTTMTRYTLIAVTAEAVDGAPLQENEKELTDSTLEFRYNPANDNAKSLDELLVANFEPLLDTWYGAGNWAKL